MPVPKMAMCISLKKKKSKIKRQDRKHKHVVILRLCDVILRVWEALLFNWT